MSRAVSQDQVMFNECIEEFRHSVKRIHERFDNVSNCHLLTDFVLKEDWCLPRIRIDRSIQIKLPGAQSAFICLIHITDKCNHRNVHLYVTALASIITFATGRRVVGPRDRFFSTPCLTVEHLSELSLSHPIITAGLGYVDTSISSETFTTFNTATQKLIKKLRSIPYENYILAMQAIRLVNLSIINKRQDFGLAYFLIVGAIEAVAQVAIRRRSVKHPKEAEWKQRAADDEQFSELLSEYKTARGNNSYLKERYTEFIYTFAPPEIWKSLLPHPLQSHLDNLRGVVNPDGSTFSSDRLWNELIPEELTTEEIRQAINASYNHRCDFVHRGGQPPHENATAYSHFFQEIREYGVSDITNT